MKKLFAVFVGIAVAILASSVVYAAPGTVGSFRGDPSSTDIVLTWNLASSSTSTLIKFRNDTFPTDPLVS